MFKKLIKALGQLINMIWLSQLGGFAFVEEDDL